MNNPFAFAGDPALDELRRARRKNHLADIDWVDALYHAYLAAVVSVVAVVWLSSIVGDSEIGPSTAARVLDQAPGWLGLLAALAVAAGLRSGSRGGPLAMETPDVRWVLLSPVSRDDALRGPAIKQLRFAALVGVVGGAFVGQLALRRFPGNGFEWVVAGAVFGGATAVAAIGSALVGSGLRVKPWIANVVSVLLLGVGVAEGLSHVAVSPFGLLGRFAVLPLHADPLGYLGVVAMAVPPVVGLLVVGGVSIEEARRRSTLVTQLRFAATLYDLRTVVLLRRQLAQERPRSQPWFRVKPSSRTLIPTLKRGVHGFLRWPLARVGRVLLLGMVAGAALLGTWEGTTPLVIVAALALFLVALDAIEPLAQETDHPVRRNALPLREGSLTVRHLITPVLVTLLVSGVALLVALPFDAGLALEVGGPMLLPAALAATCGAALSVTSEPAADVAIKPAMSLELTGIHTVLVAVRPLVMTALGVLPVLVARYAIDEDQQLLPVLGAACAVVLVIAAFVIGWFLVREDVKRWWKEQMSFENLAKGGD